MDSGNRVVIFARIPAELRELVSCYQSDRRLLSFQAALIELLETHPRIASVVEALYDGDTMKQTGEDMS